MLVSEATYVKRLASATGAGGAVTAPVFARVLGSPTTLRYLAGESRLTNGRLLRRLPQARPATRDGGATLVRAAPRRSLR